MESISRVKVALREGRQTFGLWQMIPGANVSRCLARAGADWVCVDCEHGNMDGEEPLPFHGRTLKGDVCVEESG